MQGNRGGLFMEYKKNSWASVFVVQSLEPSDLAPIIAPITVMYDTYSGGQRFIQCAGIEGVDRTCEQKYEQRSASGGVKLCED